MTEYSIVIEDAGNNLCAYVIGLDGVIATGQTVEEILDNMREAIPFHLQGLRLNGEDMPTARPIVRSVQIA